MEWNLVGLAGIITAMVGVFKYLDEKSARKNGEMLARMDEKLDSMNARIEQGQKEDKQAITRLELMTLMKYDPDNIVEIERLAKFYLKDLKGNSYMSRMFSDYAKEKGIDSNFILKEK